MATVGARRSTAGLPVALALFGTLLLNATPAVGGIGGAATPVWPLSATVGELFTASVTITNISTSPNDTEAVILTGASVTPACAGVSFPVCSGMNADPDIFKVLSAVGDTSTAPCAGVVFDVGIPDMTTGEVALNPRTTVTLGAVSGGVNRSCHSLSA